MIYSVKKYTKTFIILSYLASYYKFSTTAELKDDVNHHQYRYHYQQAHKKLRL
jgi:hypothetical protein